MKPLMVVAATGGQASGRIRELIQAARKIRRMACFSGREPGIKLILAGEDPGELARQTAAETGVESLALVLPGGSAWDLLKNTLIDLAKETDPAMILFSQTTMAREVGPALAVALGGVSVSSVLALDMDGGAFVFTRPVMDNTRVQDVRVPEDLLTVVSLAPGAAVAGDTAPEQPVKETCSGGRVTERQIEGPDKSMIRRLSLTARQGAGDGELGRAPIVVAAGRGIGEAGNLERVRAFTAAFPKAVMAASRPLVDQGWVGYDRQVGITGAVVTPDLYIALGISGSSQHLAGMAGSKWVVSVNSSPEAPICRHSDLCIQADALAFMDAFLKASDPEGPEEKDQD